MVILWATLSAKILEEKYPIISMATFSDKVIKPTSLKDWRNISLLVKIVAKMIMNSNKPDSILTGLSIFFAKFFAFDLISIPSATGTNVIIVSLIIVSNSGSGTYSP